MNNNLVRRIPKLSAPSTTICGDYMKGKLVKGPPKNIEV